MKKVAYILCLIGSVLGAVQGLNWFNPLAPSRTGAIAGTIPAPVLDDAAMALLFCSLLGLVFGFMVLMKKGLMPLNSAVLILAGLAPLIFSWNALCGLPMTAGGILSAIIYTKSQPEKN